MATSDEFSPLSAAEVQRLRVPGLHLPDRVLGGVVIDALTPAALDRISGQGAGLPRVDLAPADVLEREAPTSPAWRRWESSAVRALSAIRVASARERVAQQDALDAPFKADAKARFFGSSLCADGARAERASEASACRAGAGSAVLDTSKTSRSPVIREEIEIDRLLSRCRRLGKAVRNSAHALDSAAHLSGGFRWRRLFVTLTYREVDDWKPNHVSAFSMNVRNWFRRKAGVPARMVWVLELQQRGAVHYHCMLWIPARCRFPAPDKAGWWPHGITNVKSPKGGIQRPVSYMAKYASKVTPDQAGRVPKGARMHGAAGLDQEGKRWVRYWRAPLFARDALGGAADIRKVPGGYADKLTGLFVDSPWKVSITPGGRVIAWRLVPLTTEGTINAH